MADDVASDHLAVITIQGMHCHQCELTIQRLLSAKSGVREVEVDFPSSQASILFDKQSISVQQLMQAVNEAGYEAAGFTQRAI